MKIYCAMAFSILCTLANAETTSEQQAIQLIGTYYTEHEPNEGAIKLSDLEVLLSSAETLREKSPNAATWLADGIVRAAYAREKGGLKGLSQLKQARRSLEESIALDPQYLDSYATAFLGRLYAVVPGWPLSFGDDDKGNELRTQALQQSPNTLASAYFQTLYLIDENLHEAQAYWRDVTFTSMPCECPSWTAGLHASIEKALLHAVK